MTPLRLDVDPLPTSFFFHIRNDLFLVALSTILLFSSVDHTVYRQKTLSQFQYYEQILHHPRPGRIWPGSIKNEPKYYQLEPGLLFKPYDPII